MDTLHTMLRSIRGEAKSGRTHLTVFREFLSHLDKINRKQAARPAQSRPSNKHTAARKQRR